MPQFLHVLIVKIWLTYKNDLWHVEKTSNSTGTLTVWVKIKRMNFCKILEESLCFALKVIFRLLWLFGRRNGRTLLQNLSNISKENIFLDESKIGALPGRLLDFLTAMATQKVSIIDTKENLQITKEAFEPVYAFVFWICTVDFWNVQSYFKPFPFWTDSRSDQKSWITEARSKIILCQKERQILFFTTQTDICSQKQTSWYFSQQINQTEEKWIRQFPQWQTFS